MRRGFTGPPDRQTRMSARRERSTRNKDLLRLRTVAAVDAHILYAITDLEVGGVPLHLRRLALAMRERAFHVSVVSLAPAGRVGEMLRADGVEVGTCGGRGGWDVRVLARLRSHFRRAMPDLVHSLLFHANFASRWAADAAGIPARRVLCEIQTVEVERRWHLFVDRLTYDGCRCTIGNSPSVIEHLAEAARIPRDRLHLIRGGIDPVSIHEARPIDRETLGLRTGEKMVLWAGRLDPVKGLDFLLPAFAEIVRRHRARLFLAGGGAYEPRIREIVDRLGIQGSVHLLGPRDDVPSLLRSADLFVFPSRTEGLPNALLEAMSAGCPIVTTDVPGCHDLVTDGRTGLKVPYGDTSALANAMRRLIEDPVLARALGRAASDEVEHRWHIRETFNSYERLYREALST